MTKEAALLDLREWANNSDKDAQFFEDLITLIEQQATDLSAVKSENHLLHSQNEKLVEQVGGLQCENQLLLKWLGERDDKLRQQARENIGLFEAVRSGLRREKEQAKEIEELKATIDSIQPQFNEIGNLRTQNDGLVRLLNLALDGALTLETTMEAKALLAEVKP